MTRPAQTKRRNAKKLAVKDIERGMNYEYEPAEKTFYQHKKKPLSPRNQAQSEYLHLFTANSIVFGTGAAGSGKSYLAVAYAADRLAACDISKIILTRPAVEAGERMGFLPGELDDKFAPFIEPVRDILEDRLGKEAVQKHIEAGRIVGSPLAYMRGKTFQNCIVIFDEAQNSTPTLMKLLLTRIGENCQYFINGDTSQKDIGKVKSGIEDALETLVGIPHVAHYNFLPEDCVRSTICRRIVQAYETRG